MRRTVFRPFSVPTLMRYEFRVTYASLFRTRSLVAAVKWESADLGTDPFTECAAHWTDTGHDMVRAIAMLHHNLTAEMGGNTFRALVLTAEELDVPIRFVTMCASRDYEDRTAYALANRN